MRVPFASIPGVVALLAVACNSNTTVPLNPLPAPTDLQSVSLNQAIDLFWADNAAVSGGSRFYWYQVYSASYDLDHDRCGTWYLEGATVSPEFLAGSLTNGVPRCYRVSAISTDGAESPWSTRWQDTPRPDARNVLVYAFGTNPAASGFRFWDDVNNDGVGDAGELGSSRVAPAPTSISSSIATTPTRPYGSSPCIRARRCRCTAPWPI